MIDLFLLAGEPSGDLQGAHLIEQLLKRNPQLKIAGVAGPRMRAFPIQCVEPMENLQVMGFIDVFLALPKLIRLFFSIRKKILHLNPQAFVGIDYPGFNLRMHASLKKKSFPGKLIHYICPTVWAWGKNRIPKMANTLDLLLTLLPFEPACFANTRLHAEYVGHPLTEVIRRFEPDPTFKSRFGLLSQEKILALFPGSREKEVQRNLPLMLATAEKLKKEDPTLRIVLCSPRLPAAAQNGLKIVPFTENYNLMRHCHLALAKSGTVVLELALHKTPTVVPYAIKPLDVFLATKIFNIHLPFYSIANLILQESVFPELFGPQLTENSLYTHSRELWFDEQKREICIGLCEKLWSVLGDQPASLIAADRILRQIKN